MRVTSPLNIVEAPPATVKLNNVAQNCKQTIKTFGWN